MCFGEKWIRSKVMSAYWALIASIYGPWACHEILWIHRNISTYRRRCRCRCRCIVDLCVHAFSHHFSVSIHGGRGNGTETISDLSFSRWIKVATTIWAFSIWIVINYCVYYDLGTNKWNSEDTGLCRITVISMFAASKRRQGW